MTTSLLKTYINKQTRESTIPVTGRGRALHTIDCFLNGKPVLSNHDNPRMTLLNGLPCC